MAVPTRVPASLGGSGLGKFLMWGLISDRRLLQNLSSVCEWRTVLFWGMLEQSSNLFIPVGNFGNEFSVNQLQFRSPRLRLEKFFYRTHMGTMYVLLREQAKDKQGRSAFWVKSHK